MILALISFSFCSFVLTKEQRYRLQCYYTESGFFPTLHFLNSLFCLYIFSSSLVSSYDGSWTDEYKNSWESVTLVWNKLIETRIKVLINGE